MDAVLIVSCIYSKLQKLWLWPHQASSCRHAAVCTGVCHHQAYKCFPGWRSETSFTFPHFYESAPSWICLQRWQVVYTDLLLNHVIDTSRDSFHCCADNTDGWTAQSLMLHPGCVIPPVVRLKLLPMWDFSPFSFSKPGDSDPSEGLVSSCKRTPIYKPFTQCRPPVECPPHPAPHSISEEELHFVKTCLQRWRAEVENDMSGMLMQTISLARFII